MRALLIPLCCGLAVSISGCDYVRLLRPSVLKQLNPDVVRLVNELPAVDAPNEAILARLFAHGGLSWADRGDDGVYRDQVRVPRNEYIWKPAIVVMGAGGELELDFANEDDVFHIALVASNGNRKVLEMPVQKRGRVRVKLDQPGLYWFGCPVANHAGRGMLGIIMVKGEVDPAAKLDRPKMPRPKEH